MFGTLVGVGWVCVVEWLSGVDQGFVFMAAGHRFLKFILPGRAFEAVRAGTKKWLMECPCGHKRDVWDAGGVRYKAVGEPRQLSLCPVCGKNRWHKIRKKSEEEMRVI